MLAILTAAKWIQANWKLVAITVIILTSFGLGWYVRDYIAEAAQNQAIAAAVAETQKKEGELYAKALESEKRKRAIREKARANNAAIYQAADSGDGCGNKPLSPEWLRIIKDAYDNGTGK